MKQPRLAILAAATLLFSACESKPAAPAAEASPAPTEAPAADGSASVGSSLAGLADDAKKMKTLTALKPLGDEEMKKMLPAELAGLKRGDVSVNALMGKTVSAEYQQKPAATLAVNITDCAGEAGAGKYLMAYAGPLAAEDSKPATKETEKLTTQQRVPFAGQQAITRHDPVNDVYSVVFLNKERLLVAISGHTGLSLTELLAFATKLNAQL